MPSGAQKLMSIRFVPSPEVVMGRQIGVFVVWLAVALAAAQQGGFGGGGFGGGQGGFGGGGAGQGQGGGMQGPDGNDGANQRTLPYLSQRETTSILTPGEYVEWELDLKQSQVVIAEARSEAFDPAMEIVEGDKVLIDNDDRFPGDQRPLLLWSCPKDGKYLLRIRSFRGRAGGQVFSRHVELDCQDLAFGNSRLTPPEGDSFLYRVALKQGDFVQPRFRSGAGPWTPIRSVRITSGGLPYTDLVPGLAPAVPGALCAPVDGFYYFYVEGGFGSGPVDISLEKLIAESITKVPSESVRKAGVGAVWSMDLKKGDFIEFDSREARFNGGVYFSEAPDFTKFDPKSNPFAPKPATEKARFMEMALRGSGRSCVGILAHEDTKLWIANPGSLPNPPRLFIKPASIALSGNRAEGRMNIDHYQWWSFDANPGDVVKLTAVVSGFASEMKVQGPDLRQIGERSTFKETDRAEMVFVARHGGRHLIAVSCKGHGGTGSYSIDREVIPPQTLEFSSKVTGTLNQGEVKVFKFTMQPGPTKLLRFRGSAQYQIAGASGQAKGLVYISVGGNDYHHGVFSSPVSYLIVVQGSGSYDFSFVDPP
jgi:hypothetical protein